MSHLVEAILPVEPMPERAPVPGSDPLLALVRRAAEGDSSAFDALYDATRRRVFGLTLKVIGRRDAAEEATLDTFVQVWREAASYDPVRGDVLAWVLTLARSRAIDRLRAVKRHHSREEDLDTAPPAAAAGPDPEATRQGSEREDLVRAALASLPDEQRSAIEAAYFSGLSYADVAKESGVPLGTVKTRIRSGLATLRRRLAGPEGACREQL